MTQCSDKIFVGTLGVVLSDVLKQQVQPVLAALRTPLQRHSLMIRAVELATQQRYHRSRPARRGTA